MWRFFQHTLRWTTNKHSTVYRLRAPHLRRSNGPNWATNLSTHVARSVWSRWFLVCEHIHAAIEWCIRRRFAATSQFQTNWKSICEKLFSIFPECGAKRLCALRFENFIYICFLWFKAMFNELAVIIFEIVATAPLHIIAFSRTFHLMPCRTLRTISTCNK